VEGGGLAWPRSRSGALFTKAWWASFREMWNSAEEDRTAFGRLDAIRIQVTDSPSAHLYFRRHRNRFAFLGIDDLRVNLCCLASVRCPSSLLTVYRSAPLERLNVANVCLDVWKEITLLISACFAQAFIEINVCERLRNPKTFLLGKATPCRALTSSARAVSDSGRYSKPPVFFCLNES
jgi:hypothetical protein